QQRTASNAASSKGPQSIQWTTIVTGHLKKQLNELVPPPLGNTNNASSPHSGGTPNRGYKSYNHHEGPGKPWLTPESRKKFEQRWSYSVQLARWQYHEGLIDQRTFLKWSLDTLAASTSFELIWVILTGLIQDYVDEYKRNRTLTKILIETLIKYYGALLQYMNQVTSDEMENRVHQGLKRDLETMIQSLFLSTPDMFVIPKLYQQYHHLLNSIIQDQVTPRATKSLTDVRRVMNEYWTVIKARNEVFCGNVSENPTLHKTQPVHETSGDEERVVNLLDSIGKNIDSVAGLLISGDTWIDVHGHSAKWGSKMIFSKTRLELESILKLVHSICRWAVNESRYGDWKAYLVASILLSWKEEGDSMEKKKLLQEALIRFLDGETSPKNMDMLNGSQVDEEGNYIKKTNNHVIYLFDVLIRSNLFSYQKYLLRLIARGDLEPKRRNEHTTQLHYLASFPLLTPAPTYLINQRRIALYGTRHDNTKETENEALDNLKHLSRLAVIGFDHHNTDCLFGAEAQDMTQPVPTDTFESYNMAFSQELKHKLINTMESTTRYSVLEFTGDWLLSEVKKFVVKSIQIGEDNWRVMTSPGSCLLNMRQLVTIIQIMECAKDYLSIIETALWVLQKSNDVSLHPYIIDTFRKYSCYWKLTNNCTRVVQAMWAKHATLSSRGERDRNVMMYLIQLVQEGYQMEDMVRTQLQQDLQVKIKTRGRYTNDVSAKNELLQLTKNPQSIQMASESLSLPTQNAAGWIGVILENAGEVLRMVGKEKRIDEEIKSYRHGRFLSQALYEFHRLLRALALVIKQVANATLMTGQADATVIYWLWNNEVVQEDMYQENSWVPLFVIILVVNNVIALDTLIKDFAIPWFERIGQEGQQQYAEDTKLNVFCQNLIVLIRLLVIQNDNEPKSEEAPLSWQLRNEEFFQLEVQRQTYLASSLDKIDPLFGLMERMIQIATNLPLSSSLLQDLVMLRADLLQIPWFRQACLRDLNGVYQRFASREAEAATEKRLKKRMLSIVEELIGGNLVSQSNMQENPPKFVDKLHKVFLNVSQWNEAQCRVQMNLLLDNISLYDVNSQNPNNPHILGDDLSLDITSETSTSPTNEDLQSFVSFFYDVVLADGKEESERAATQRRFQFFKNLIHELRESVLSELLVHAVRLLEGDTQVFPDSVLLLQSSEQAVHFNSDSFTYRSQAFLSMTQHMLAENVWPGEKRIDLVKTMFKQILRFRDSLPVYKVMQYANVCFTEASVALQTTKNNADMAIAMLLTGELSDSMPVEVNHDKKVSLEDLRTR
ncbi:RNA polymerase II mediator complex subunit, partial [Rhizopus stolonifer]